MPPCFGAVRWLFSVLLIGASAAAFGTAGFLNGPSNQTPGALWAIVGDGTGLFSRSSPTTVARDVTAVAVGWNHSAFIKSDGSLWLTGDNSHHQVGCDSTSTGIPVQVATDVASVSLGEIHTAFLKSDGTLWTMGGNGYGQLGDGTTVDRSAPVQVATNVAAVSCAFSNTAFIKTDGTLWVAGAWAASDGTTILATTPVQVASDVATVSAGGSLLFIKTDHTLWAVGRNNYGKFGDGTTTDRFTPVQVATDVAKVSNSGSHTLFVKNDGTLWSMGSNSNGALGDGTTTNRSSPVQVATDVASASADTIGLYSMFIKTDGTVWAMGANFYGAFGTGTASSTPQTTPIQVGTDAAAVAASGNFSLTLRTDGRLVAVGANYSGQLGDLQIPAWPRLMANDVTSVGVDSLTNSLFVKSDGTVWQTGSPNVQIPGLTGIVQAISFDNRGNRYVVKNDGSLWKLAVDGTPTLVDNGVVSAGAGYNYVVYLKGDGTLWGQGNSYDVKLGNGVDAVQVADHVTSFSAAWTHYLFVKDDHTLWGQGYAPDGFIPGSNYGQLQMAPAQLDTNISWAIANFTQNIYLKTDGTLWTRGAGWADWTGPAAQVDTDVTAAAVSSSFGTFYLKADGILRFRSGIKDTLGAITLVAANVVALADSSYTNYTVMFVQSPAQGSTPVIAAPPQSTAITSGSPVTLQVGVTGTAPFAYQWYKDGVAIPDAIAAQYSLPDAQATDAGSYTVTVTNAVGSATSQAATLLVSDTIAAVTLNGLNTTYDGSPKPVTATTNPAGKTVSITYDGSTTAPTNAGSYAVVATVSDASYSGLALGTLVIEKAAPTITWSQPATITYGTALSSTQLNATTSVLGTFVYNPTAGTVLNVGANQTLAVTFTPTDAANYNSTTSQRTITVNPAGQTISFTGPTNQTFGVAPLTLTATATSGLPVSFSVVSGPASVSGNMLTITGAGTVVVRATQVGNGNYSNAPEVDRTFNVAKATATVSLGNLSATYNGSPKTVTATTTPGGLAVDVTYSGTATAPTNAGSYAVVGTINDTNYSGSASGSLEIAKAAPAISWATPAPIVYGTALSSTQLNATATVAGTFVYNPAAGAVLAVGNPTLNVVFTPTDAANYTNASEQRSLTVSLPGIVAVSASDHTMFIRADGTLWAVGSDGHGQLGTGVPGSTLFLSTPVQVASQVVAVSAGRWHTLFIKADQTLWAMGGNLSGQLGNGDAFDVYTPVQVATNVVAAAAGTYQSLFVKADGTLWAMGGNGYGQLGTSSAPSGTVTPIQVATDVVSVSAGYNFSLFVKSDGTLWGVGANDRGELASPLSSGGGGSTPKLLATSVTTAEAKQGASFFIKTDGSLWGMGNGVAVINTPGGQAQFATNVVAVSAGVGGHAVFLKTDGTAWGLGNNDSGQLGDGTTTDRPTPVQIAANIAAIAAGTGHSLLVDTGGAMMAMGDNASGQLGDGTLVSHLNPAVVASGPLTVPAAPTGVTATDGTLIETIRVTWHPVIGASAYEVWRHTANSSASAVKVAQGIRQALYYDNTTAAGASYYYWIKAVNAAGASTLGGSDAGSAMPAVAPTINTQPQSQVKAPGDAVALIVVASGAPQPSYQWMKNGAVIAGATSATYTIASATSSDAGSYTVVVTNIAGTATSNAAVLTITQPGVATITTQPTNQTVNVGGTTTLSVTAIGVLAQSYQWRRNGVDIPGATGATLTIDNTAAINAGEYTVVITNSAGSVTSNTVTVTVKTESSIWLMNGTAFKFGVSLGYRDSSWQLVTAADFNGDNKPDILLQNTVTGERQIQLLDGASQTSTVSLGILDPNWQMVAATDFNGDHKPDIVLQNTVTGQRVLWLMNGTTYSSTLDLGTYDLSWRIATAADFDGDGKADLLWQNTATGQCTIWLMNGTSFVWGVDLGTYDLKWRMAAVADFDGDGKVAIIWQDATTGRRNLWLMNGTQFVYGVDLGTYDLGWRIVAVADFDRDGKKDILWQRMSFGETGTADLGTVDPNWKMVGTGDFNGDHNPDIVWQNPVTGQRSISLMNGSTLSYNADLGVVDTNWQIAAIADFNHDGKSDLVWQNVSTGQRSIWLMNGTTFGFAVSLGVVDPNWRIATAADFNGDGNPDIVWQNLSTGQRAMWLMNGPAYFFGVDLGTVDLNWRISAAADFTGDGKPDMLWQNLATGQAIVWRMNGVNGIEALNFGTYDLNLQCVGAADFDHRGGPDLLWQNLATGQRSISFISGSGY